jgi:hypothetical protein
MMQESVVKCLLDLGADVDKDGLAALDYGML